MIVDQLDNKGEIKDEHRLKFVREKRQTDEAEQSVFALLPFE